MASGQSTVPNFTVSSDSPAPPPPPPPQAPKMNAPTTSKRQKSATLINLPPLSTYPNPFSHRYFPRETGRASPSEGATTPDCSGPPQLRASFFGFRAV